MQKILAHMWPYNFLHFSQQYTVHIMARRAKNRAGFSHVRVCGLQRRHFPRQICAYILWSRGAKRHGGFAGSSRLELAMGISCLWWTQTRLKSAQMARHGYDTICNQRPELVCRISYRQVISRQPRIILRWKNVWMYINLPCKNVML